MSKREWKNLFYLFAGCVLAVVFANRIIVARAQSLTPTPSPVPVTLGKPPGPNRFQIVGMDYTVHEWWISAWSDNSLVCQLFINHDGAPTDDEIFTVCGEDTYDTWAETQPCDNKDKSTCDGFLMHKMNSVAAHRDIGVALPPAEVFISLDGCDPDPQTSICPDLPKIILSGVESLPNERITRIEGKYNNTPFACDTDRCELTLSATGSQGVTLEFWAFSSHGDSTIVYQASLRAIAVSDREEINLPVDEISTSWYVSVISTQWQGVMASCSDTWNIFPPVGGAPAWLTTPDDVSGLTSDIPYAYLAGNLITQGVANAEFCADGGLLPSGAASRCGQDAAREEVFAWQNQFDALILSTSQQTGVPAQLLKNLFSRESQFWPGVFRNSDDVGLGQLTENGADTTLLWNPDFYGQFCPLVLDKNNCKKQYAVQSFANQSMLRAALVNSVNATCEYCPLGLDLSKANFSIGVFAESLLANCGQTAKVVRNVYSKAPNQASDYENMWKFTLVNYNAGAGCLYDAMKVVRSSGKPLNWENLSEALAKQEVCALAIDYVNDISR